MIACFAEKKYTSYGIQQERYNKSTNCLKCVNIGVFSKSVWKEKVLRHFVEAVKQWYRYTERNAFACAKQEKRRV